jgi:PBP1b-binding outer membrane lipoprotein LpoB
MKALYTIAMVVALLIIAGCAKPATNEAAPSAPAQTSAGQQPAAAATTETAATGSAETTATSSTSVAEQKNELSYEGSDPAVARMITMCEAGNLGLCTTLKTKYGVNAQPKSAAQQEAAEPAEGTTA